MSSEFLEFVAAIRALNIENKVDVEHFSLWKNNNQNNRLLPLIASLNIVQVRLCLLFGSSPRVIEEVSRRINSVTAEHLEIFFSLARNERILKNIHLISLLSDAQAFVCLRLRIFTIDGIIDLLNREITDYHVLVYKSFAEEEQTSYLIRLILSLEKEYYKAFLSLPLPERFLETLESISLYSYEIIEIFLNFPDEEQNSDLLEIIAELPREKIWLLKKAVDINSACLSVVVDLSDEDTRFCLELFEYDLDILNNMHRLDSIKRQIVLSLEKKYRVIRFVNTVLDFSQEQVDVWSALASEHHTAENFMQLYEMAEEQISLCKSVVSKDAVLSINLFEAALALDVSNKYLQNFLSVLRLEELPKNEIQRDRSVAANIFAEAFVTTIICRDIAPQFSNISDVYNYSKVVCNVAPIFSRAVVRNVASYELTLFIHQSLRYGFPQNYDDAVNFSIKYMMTYAPPKVLSYFCATQFDYSITKLSVFGSTMLYMAIDVDSKSIREIWTDTIKYNSSPGAIGIFSMSIAQGAAFTFVPSLAIGGAAALTADYLWTAYEEGSLQVLPSSLDFAYDAIFG